MYRVKQAVPEVWAVLDQDGAVMWSRGGSSTARRLMVYPTKAGCEIALRSVWIKQVIPDCSKVRVERIYTQEGGGT